VKAIHADVVQGQVSH